MKVFWIFLVFLTSATATADTAFLLVPALSWEVVSLRPLGEEETPTFYGYGYQLGAGVSHLGVEGLLNLKYLRAQTGAAGFMEGDTFFLNYGLSVGYRYRSEAYVGILVDAVGFNTPEHHFDNEIVGKWSGSRLGLHLSGSWRVGRDKYLDLGVIVATATLLEQNRTGKLPRTLDSIALNLAYMLIWD